MASYNELSFDWNILFQQYEQWTSADLQLAAELGKTLLERNKELETAIKHHQNVIDDQAQEIEYLQKQTAALREVNDSRLRIYEQLEVGIQDLERANHRLIVENTTDKKQIKSLQTNIENLEAKCEELNKSLEEAKKSILAEKRKNERILQEHLNCNSDGKDTIKLRKYENSNYAHDEYNPDQAQIKKETERDFVDFSTSTSSSSTNKCGMKTSTTINDELKIENESSSKLESSNQCANNNSTCNAKNNFIYDEENEEVIRIISELETTRKALISEQQRCTELEEQLVTIIQENQSLQSRIAQTSTNEEMKSVHDELSILDEVRQGTMCSRCLRSMDDKAIFDENLSVIGTEDDDDDRSVMSDVLNSTEIAPTQPIYRSAVTIKTGSKPNSLDINLSSSSSNNPYRELVEKYEALLEVQRHSINRSSGVTRQQHQQQNLIIIEEAGQQTSGEFSSIHTKESYDEANDKDQNNVTLTNQNIDDADNATTPTENKNASLTAYQEQQQQQQKSAQIHHVHHKISARRTPTTDFSEAETSSSGFSDEISHKSTQTDERPGYFLCSIGDGENCKFSIYDDASPIDSRFRNRPEYRELFKEIFAVLKKAAENKEEGENLPLLDDTHPSKVPPVTPANEDLPNFCDDTQSVISSAVSEQSIAMSECITKIERKTAKKHLKEINQENKPTSAMSGGATGITTSQTHIVENGRILTPLKREPLEYVQVGVGIKKKNRRKHRNLNLDRSDSPVLPSPPKVFYNSGKKRRDVRPFIPPISPSISNNSTPRNYGGNNSNNTGLGDWSGNSVVYYNRNVHLTSPSTGYLRKNSDSNGTDLNLSNVEYKPSTVSQDLHKLKKLDLSYAEVLRRADACSHHHRRKK